MARECCSFVTLGAQGAVGMGLQQEDGRHQAGVGLQLGKRPAAQGRQVGGSASASWATAAKGMKTSMGLDCS